MMILNNTTTQADDEDEEGKEGEEGKDDEDDDDDDIAWTQGQTRREREQETPWLHSTTKTQTSTYPLIPHREFPTVVTD